MVQEIKKKLNITFHNPNTPEELAHELIILAAELAQGKIIEVIKNEKE